MTRILTVAYLARQPRAGPSDHFSSLARAFSVAQSKADWPYDVGDDPAFFCADLLNGPVTWGVCRQDARSQLQPDDLVLFFASSYDAARRISIYRLSAGLTVELTITQDQVFGASASPFAQYLNLLVRPKARGWEHFEPGLPLNEWHDDWLWRVCDHKGSRKHEFVLAGKNHKAGEPLRVAGLRRSFARNYVVFSADPSRSAIFQSPPIVAELEPGSHFEKWRDTPAARQIHSLSFGTGTRKNLRTRNRQQPHRHIWGYSDSAPDHILSRLVQAVSTTAADEQRP